MISLSKMKQYHEQNHKEKVIQIKPIEFKKVEHAANVNPSISFEEEKNMLEKEIQNLQDQIENLKREKERMIDSTKEEIKREKENWDQEKKLLINQGYQEGYEIGISEGRQKAEVQYETLINQMNDLEKMAIKDYHTRLEQTDHVIVDLSVNIAEKIIQDEIAKDPKMFLNIVTAAITEIKDQSQISIHAHPDNYEILMKQKGELINTLDGDTKLSIFMNQKMTVNECLIEHPFGQVDASVDTQLEQIRDVLHQVTMEINQ